MKDAITKGERNCVELASPIRSSKRSVDGAGMSERKYHLSLVHTYWLDYEVPLAIAFDDDASRAVFSRHGRVKPQRGVP